MSRRILKSYVPTKKTYLLESAHLAKTASITSNKHF